MNRSICVAGWFAALLAASPVIVTAASLYVDPQGDDGGSASQTQPLRTISRAASLAQPGDVVVVSPGTYQEAVVLPRSGQLGAPIVFRGLPGTVMVSPDALASLSAFDVGANAYVALQGFEMSGGFDETVFVRPGAHDVELSALHIHGNHAGIWIAGASNVTVSDAVIDHNYRTGVRLLAGARNIHIVDTRSEANDDGLSCDGDSDGFNADDSTSNVTFERATALGNSEDGFDLHGPNMTLLQVTAQDNGCSGVKIAAGGYLENLLVERSRIGLDVTAPSGVLTMLENGTLSENDVGVRATGSGHTLTVRNSIVAGPAKAFDYAAAVTLNEDHNILFRLASGERLIVREDAGEIIYSGDDVKSGKWQHDSGQGDATVYADPDFQPGGTQLGAASPAIDSGAAVGAPNVDLDGTPRPLGAAVDRGAFESVPSPATLRVRRALLRADKSGSGRLQLLAGVTVPPSLAFDASVDPVSVDIRGARGEIVRLDVQPSAWRRARGGNSLRFVQGIGSSATSLKLRLSRGSVSVQLQASDIDGSKIDGSPVTVVVELGTVRASGDATLRLIGYGR